MITKNVPKSERVFLSGSPVFWINSKNESMQVRGGNDIVSTSQWWAHGAYQIREGQDAALKLIESEIAQHKGGGAFGGEFPERWLPAAVAILGEGFTEQNHFLNSTLKMVRGKITEFYRDRIDYLFTAAGKEICNQQNRMIVKRMG